MRPATRTALARGALAALANAERLLTDAQALLALGSAPTAYSLAVLAMEEASKANDWQRIAAESGDTPVDLGRKQHKDRLRPVRQSFDYVQALHELVHDPDGYKAEPEESWRRRIEEEISTDNAMKQRGFYVDVDGGEVLEPSLISAAQAQAMVDDAAMAIALMESLKE
jgi:AbiV family abortive infection protein